MALLGRYQVLRGVRLGTRMEATRWQCAVLLMCPTVVVFRCDNSVLADVPGDDEYRGS